MDNQYGLKAVEKQNEITEQALEPKRQFETQLDTPLTMGEYNAIADIYQNSDDKERDILKFGQALEYKRNYGLDLDYAYNNIDALNEARGIPQEYNWSTLQSIKNSFKISALNDKLSDLNSAWMDADYAGQDKAEIEKQIADVESQIEGLQDYAPRSLVTNMMKWAAESSVFTLTTIRDSLTWGAGAGLALAGLAGLAGVPITAGMTLTGLAWASLAGAVGTAATIGGTVSVANKTQGTMYRELRNQGVEKNLARSAASINGYVNGYIETALGVVPAGVGAVLKATGVEKLTATTMARLAMRGTWGTLGKMLANHVVDSIGEGEEEFFQSLADDITDAVVLTISDECKANGVKFDKSVGDVIRDALKAGGQGFGAALIMGVPTTAVNANVSVKEARRLKAEAKMNPSEADFVRHHENDSAFEGLEKKEVKDMLHQMYKAQNEVPVEERIDQTTIDSDIIEENVDIESEEDEEAVASEVPEKDIERMENGRLRTQEEKDYDVDLEGNEKHTLKVGTPNSSTRYGRVEYTINKDGSIEIDKVSTKAGFQKAVTKDAVLELMRRYAGQDVVWNPTNAYQQKIKAELEKENGGKLQRFASEYNQSEEAELGDFLHEKYGQFTPTQGKLLYGLYKNIAQHYGQTVHEMIADAKANNPRAALRFRYMSDAVKEGLIDEKQARRRGLIDYANRVIYVGENGDITTLFHEGFHMLSKVDKEGAQELVKAILESKDMESYFKSHRAFFVPQLGLTVDEIMQELSNLSEDSDKWTENQDEILTSMFEAYLRDGKTFSKKLENIFSRIADFFIQIYRTLAGGNHLNDNIIKAFDKILEGNPELKEKFDQTEGVRAQGELSDDVRDVTPEQIQEATGYLDTLPAKEKKRISANLKNHKYNDDGTYTGWYDLTIKSLVVKNHLRFQNELTEDERSQLVAEAREFDTFDDFLNYLSIMNGWVDPAQYSDALDVLDEIYGEAHGFTREKAKLDIDLSGLTDDEKDRTFEEYIDGDGIKNIMKMLHDMYTTYYGYVYAHGGLEDDEIEDAESLRARIREFEDNASMFIVNLAKSKKELSDKQFNSIRNVIKKNTRMYRELIADTLESETLRSDAEPDIKGTRGEESPTLADRSELEKDAGTSLDDKVEGEIEKKLDQLDKELSDDEKAAEALTRELDSLMGELKGELTPEEQKALKNIQFLERFRGRKDEYAKALKKKIDNGEAISQAENTRLETVAKKIKELEQALAKFNDKQKAKNFLDKQNALKELKAEIREKQKQRRALKEMHEYKHKLISYLQRKVPKSVAYEYKGMIEAIISMFSDVSGYDNNITYRGKSLTPKEFREAVDKDGALDELSKYQLKRYNGKSLADYTVEELERFADVKKRLVNIGRQMWQAKVDARNAEAAQIRQIILNHLRKNPKYTTAPLPDTKEDKDQKKTFRKKFSEIFTRTIPMSRITQMLDGGEKGFIYDLLTRDKRLVQDMERLAVRERINRVQTLMDKLGVKKEDFYKPVEMSIRQSDDLGPASEIEKYTDTYTLGQLIYGILAQRNIRNANAFMFGDLVTQDDKAILNHNNDLIYDLGMKRNERFVKQAEEILKQYPNLMQVADAIVADWQDINNKTRLNQVMIDEYNQGLDMEDFYMPIKRLDFNGTSLAQSIADDVYNQNAGKGMTTPKKGITYARIDISPDHQKRTNMDFLELWLNSVDEQEHLIATNAYVRKLNRVFKGRGSEDLRSAIENIYGQHITEDIDNYINDFANPPKAAEDRNVSKWIRFMRGRLYEAYLGFKLSSFVLQVITSPAPFLREVNALQLSDYILKVMANPSKYWKFITERSTMMESRSIDPILAEIKKEKNDFTANQFVRTYHKALAFGTGLLEVADRWMVSAGWLACYEKAMAKRQEAINNGDMTQMQAELEASQYADEVVLETQPTGDRSELSPIFKTGSAAWQALTQFTTSLNVIWTNLLYDARTDLQNRNFKRAIMTAFAYALAGTVLYAVQDYEPPEDDENWIKDTILKLIYGMTSQGVSSVPLLGSDIDKFFKETLTGERQYTARKLYPAFDTAREAVTRITQGKFDLKTLGKVTESIGLFVGLPVSGGKELLHIFRDRDGNWRYRGKRLTDNELLDFILKEKWQSVLGRRDNYGNKQHKNKK